MSNVHARSRAAHTPCPAPQPGPSHSPDAHSVLAVHRAPFAAPLTPTVTDPLPLPPRLPLPGPGSTGTG